MGTGCQPLVTMPSLAPATLLCFCQTFEADSPPPSRSPALKAPCVSLINFVLREQMVRAESGGIYPPSFHHQYSLQQATHVDELWAAQCLEWSGMESQLSAYDP